MSENDILEEATFEFGVNYVVVGLLNSQTEKNPLLKTVWCISNGSEIPNLVTAYPF